MDAFLNGERENENSVKSRDGLKTTALDVFLIKKPAEKYCSGMIGEKNEKFNLSFGHSCKRRVWGIKFTFLNKRSIILTIVWYHLVGRILKK